MPGAAGTAGSGGDVKDVVPSLNFMLRTMLSMANLDSTRNEKAPPRTNQWSSRPALGVDVLSSADPVTIATTTILGLDFASLSAGFALAGPGSRTKAKNSGHF